MINYVLVERSFKKDPTWKDRDSSVGASAFGNLIFVSFTIFYFSEKLFGSENTAKFFSIDFPLYAVGVGLSFIVIVFSLILFSYLKNKDKRIAFRIAVKVWHPINRQYSIIIRIIIFVIAAYSFNLLVDEMLGIS
jgi:uncharacterized membrane protein YkvI